MHQHEPHEFVCADCKSNVYSYGGLNASTRCASCEVVFEMKAAGKLSPHDEATLRELLGCQIPKGDDDALREADGSSDRPDPS
jgi:hypothetical protein